VTDGIRFAADPCEWHPSEQRERREGDARHADAQWSLGDGEWHLCSMCAALPVFARYRVRKALRQPGGTL
jgi:DNA-binding IclR family transcriptional regulator